MKSRTPARTRNYQCFMGTIILGMIITSGCTTTRESVNIKEVKPVSMADPVEVVTVQKIEQMKPALTAVEVAAGWQNLLAQDTAPAWKAFKSDTFPEKGWQVEDGVLRVLAGGGGGDIITRDQFTNFELMLDWKVAHKANSGIMYRVTEGESSTWRTGPEYQILDDVGYGLAPDEMHSAGALYDLYAPPPTKQVALTGEYNHACIVLDSDQLQHWLNDQLIVQCDLSSDDWKQRVGNSKFNVFPSFGTEASGHIALQDHGNDVWFKNIKIRDLDAPMPGEITLFNGSNTDGWTVYTTGDQEDHPWRVEDGILICRGTPPGYIRTTKRYGNFVLKLEWRWNPDTKKGGNSGVLLRINGEDKVWPRSVEGQLHSGNAGDIWNIGNVPMLAAPERTEGRRTRNLRSNENPVGEWNEYEIIVDGPTITLIVNGMQVNQVWNVETTPGWIGLQSEGTEIQFRNVRLAPIIY